MSQKLILLSNNDSIDRRHKEVLSHIREAYGNTTQILVSNEELCELAAVCAKFPRYTDPAKARSELHSAAVDEVADVMIILDHIINIFQLDDLEIKSRIQGKIDRIGRWLSKSSNQEQTTVDREVREGENPQPEEKAPEKPAEHPVKEGEEPKQFTTNNIPCKGCDHMGDFQALKPEGRCWRCAQKDFSLYESNGVGRGYRVRHQVDPKSGSSVPKEDFVLLLTRATKLGKEFPDECILHILPNHRGLRFLIEEYGITWEALWP